MLIYFNYSAFLWNKIVVCAKINEHEKKIRNYRTKSSWSVVALTKIPLIFWCLWIRRFHRARHKLPSIIFLPLAFFFPTACVWPLVQLRLTRACYCIPHGDTKPDLNPNFILAALFNDLFEYFSSKRQTPTHPHTVRTILSHKIAARPRKSFKNKRNAKNCAFS